MRPRTDLSEQPFTSWSGYVVMLIAVILLCIAAWFGYGVAMQQRLHGNMVGFILTAAPAVFLLVGLFTIQPNEGAILTLFGDYRGTERESGLRWCAPFYTRKIISLRSRNLNSEKLKVNDKNGNPIEIGAAIVWRVQDSAKAVFEINDYEAYVHVQSEAAIRHLASSYNYDNGGDDGKHSITLRGGADTVAKALRNELQERFEKAGVAVEEAKLTHLAYAPEIASAMLRRQQAEAIIDARSKIVHGAVTMVEMALKGLSEKNLVQLDNERKAAMVCNLLVVLCAESNVQPILSTGTPLQ